MDENTTTLLGQPGATAAHAGAPVERGPALPESMPIARPERRRADLEALAARAGRLAGDVPLDEAKLRLLALAVLSFGRACCVARAGSQQPADAVMRHSADLLIEGGLWFDEIDQLHAACRLLIHRHASGTGEIGDAG